MDVDISFSVPVEDDFEAPSNDSLLNIEEFTQDGAPILISQASEDNIKVNKKFQFDDDFTSKEFHVDDDVTMVKHWQDTIDTTNNNNKNADSDDSDTENPFFKEKNSDKMEFLTSVNDKLDHYKYRRDRRWAKIRQKDPDNNDIIANDKWIKYINESREKPLVYNQFEKVEQPRKKRKIEKDPIINDMNNEAIETIDEDFISLNLSRKVLRAIRDLGWEKPTPIQSKCIPEGLKGVDILANAVTGSGKTAAFIIPILERLLNSNDSYSSKVLIITPTRELAVQCLEMTKLLSKFCKIKMSLVVGGLNIEVQEISLRKKPDIIICTPGRMIDLLRNSNGITLDDIQILVLDEADRLLDMGFVDEIKQILNYIPKENNKQTLLFSATLTDKILKLVDMSLNNPVRISVDPSICLVDKLQQEFVRIHPGQEKYRMSMLLALCLKSFTSSVIIFCRTKKETHFIRLLFGMFGLNACELHGNMNQTDRFKSLNLFRKKKCNYLLCTDVAARGIDIKNVEIVINIEFPTNINTYIHRVGRTARAGNKGTSITLVGEKRRKLLKKLVKKQQNESGNNNKMNMKSRIIDINFINWINRQILDMKQYINDLIKEESSERELRLAHIQLNKSNNIIKYSHKIFNNNKKTWFINKEKKKENIKYNAHLNDLQDDEYKNELLKKIQNKIELNNNRKLKKLQQKNKHINLNTFQFKNIMKEREQKKLEMKKEKAQRKKELDYTRKLARSTRGKMKYERSLKNKLNRTKYGMDYSDEEDNSNNNKSNKKIKLNWKRYKNNQFDEDDDGDNNMNSNKNKKKFKLKDRLLLQSSKEISKSFKNSKIRKELLKKRMKRKVKKKTRHAKRRTKR